MNDQSPDFDPSTSADASRGPISRRTVIAGTAFAVPAIVLTAGTPALAASGVTLAFDKSVYSGAGCSTISGAKVFATQAGTPKAGVAVTVSLANGYTFSGGGTTYTGVTGSGGSLTLPDINVPVGGGSSTATATSAGATSSSASLSGTQATGPVYLDNGTQKSAVGVPANSTPALGAQFVAPDGRLINGQDGTIMATNVDSVGAVFISNNLGRWYLPLKKRDGACVYLENGTEKAAVGVPSGSKPAVGAAFLASDGRLIDGQNGSVLAANVAAFGQVFIADSIGRWYLPLRKTNGACTYLDNGTETTAVGVPSSSTPAWGAGFIAPDGRLINGQDATVMATNVDSIGEMFVSNNLGRWYIPLKKRNGACTYLENSTEQAAVGVPSGSSPAWGAGFLASDGRLINGQDGSIMATNVSSFGAVFIADSIGRWYVPLGAAVSSC